MWEDVQSQKWMTIWKNIDSSDVRLLTVVENDQQQIKFELIYCPSDLIQNLDMRKECAPRWFQINTWLSKGQLE